MRQLVYDPLAQVRWEQADPPTLSHGADVLVRPVAVAVCDADRAILAGKIPQRSSYSLGHEFVADIIAVGERVVERRVRERVVVPFKISCGSCRPCRRGDTAACDTVPLRSAYGFAPEISGSWGGAISDVVRVPFADHMLVPLPIEVDPSVAAAVGDNLADAYRCVAPGLEAHPGAPVLVMAGGGGAPSISLYAAAIAVALGADRVDYVDRDDARLAIAETLGANPIASPRPPADLGEYLVTADTSGHPAGHWLRATIEATAPYGTCTSCGAYFADVTLPLGAMYAKGIHFTTGWVNARPLIPPLLAHLASGDLDIGPVHTQAAWDDAPEAIQTLPPGKLVLLRDAPP